VPVSLRSNIQKTGGPFKYNKTQQGKKLKKKLTVAELTSMYII
jgi:hypothetical protein